MKIISYNPSEIKDAPTFFNKYLEEFSNEDYVMFIFSDLAEKIRDKNEFNNKYATLMRIFNLPFAFYPYYIHFNRILPDSIAKPVPRAHVKSKYGVFDIINSPAYGMLMLDVQKLKSINFKFNPEYKLSFYIQDLIHECFTHKLWFSETCFLDLYNSFEMFTEDVKTGYTINPKEFAEEKQKFFNNVKVTSEQINDFIKLLKEKFGTVQEAQDQNQGA